MATRKRVIPRRSLGDLVPIVKEYVLNRSMRERSEYHEGRIKRDLMNLLETAGDQESEGVQKLALDEPVSYQQMKNGQPVNKTVVGIERRERKSNSLDEDRTMALLKEKGLVEQCTETVIVVNEDAILAANYSGDITDDELAALYQESSTFAFYLTEG